MVPALAQHSDLSQALDSGPEQASGAALALEVASASAVGSVSVVPVEPVGLAVVAAVAGEACRNRRCCYRLSIPQKPEVS